MSHHVATLEFQEDSQTEVRIVSNLQPFFKAGFQCDKELYSGQKPLPNGTETVTVRQCKCLTVDACGNPGKMVAVKTVALNNALQKAEEIMSIRQGIVSETSKETRAAHMVLPQYITYFENVNVVLEITPLCATDLDKYITDIASSLQSDATRMEFQLACLMRDMLLGVKAIHGAKYVHGDIKPPNMLMSTAELYPDSGEYPASDVPYRARYMDFEGAKKMIKGSARVRFMTLPYTGTRTLTEADFSGEADVDASHDVYSIGATAVQFLLVVTGKRSLDMLCGSQVKRMPSGLLSSGVTPEVCAFVMGSLREDRSSRASVHDLLSSAFLKKYVVILGFNDGDQQSTLSDFVAKPWMATGTDMLYVFVAVVLAGFVYMLWFRKSAKPTADASD